MHITFIGNFSVPFSSESHHRSTLQSLGHSVYSIQENSATGYKEILKRATNSDLLIWVHTHGWNPELRDTLEVLRRQGIPSLAYHLDLWFGLGRQRDLSDQFFKVEHFFTVDKKMADYFNASTSTKGHYIQAGVLAEECTCYDLEMKRDVIFVGSKDYHEEWAYRPQLIDWLERNFGSGFTHIAGGYRGWQLNDLYQSTKVVVGDSCCIGFDYPYYWSDRIYETIGRGGFIIHPYIKGLEKHFTDGKHCVFYKFGDWNELRDKINYYLKHDHAREKIRLAGHRHVKKNHTYTNRWKEILKKI